MTKLLPARYRTTNLSARNAALRKRGSLKLLVDSTGIKFLCDGEWQARKHGLQGRRQWRKIHLAMDTATSDIRAVEFAPRRDGDSPFLPDLLDQIPEEERIGTLNANGAYDTRRCHTAIMEHYATAITPIRKNGRPWKENGPAALTRNEILRAKRHLGRAFWKLWTGYHLRSRVEAKMWCLKAFGERIAAKDPDRQTAEITSASLSRTASQPSALLRSCAWNDLLGERATGASSLSSTTTPLKTASGPAGC
jgi:hypothetical protein